MKFEYLSSIASCISRTILDLHLDSRVEEISSQFPSSHVFHSVLSALFFSSWKEFHIQTNANSLGKIGLVNFGDSCFLTTNLLSPYIFTCHTLWFYNLLALCSLYYCFDINYFPLVWPCRYLLYYILSYTENIHAPYTLVGFALVCLLVGLIGLGKPYFHK